MIGQKPVCLICKHFNKDDKNAFTCAAYPNGIPDIISTGLDVHDEPLQGDNGIQFEPADNADNG